MRGPNLQDLNRDWIRGHTRQAPRCCRGLRRSGSWLGTRRPGRKRNAEMGAALAIAHDLDATVVSHYKFPCDREPQTAAPHAAVMNVLALIKPVENPVAILGRNSRTRVSHVEHYLSPLSPQRQGNHTLVRRVFDRIGDQIRRNGAQFFLVGLKYDRIQPQVGADATSLDREPVIFEHLFHDPVESHRRHLQPPHALLRSMVIQKALDQLLQLHALLPENFDDFAQARRERAGGPLDQQLRSFAKRRQGRLQLVRNVAQEQALLLLEFDQPLSQPVEPAAQVFQVRRPADPDIALELAGAEAPDSLVELADGSSDEERDSDRKEYPERDRRGELQPEDALRARARAPHGFHLAVDQGVARIEHVPRQPRQHQVAFHERLLFGRRLRFAEQLFVERLLLVDGGVELVQLRLVERLQGQLAGVRLEVRSQPSIILEEFLVVEDEILTHDPFERRGLLDQEPAAARGLRRLRNRGLALTCELLDVHRGVVKSHDERRRDEREGEQQQAEKRSRIVALGEVEPDFHGPL